MTEVATKRHAMINIDGQTYAFKYWFAYNGWQYRIDKCEECHSLYVNRRKSGCDYQVHAWWHYCTKRRCYHCYTEKLGHVPSFSIDKMKRLMNAERGETA
jgi:hypothetical protein